MSGVVEDARAVLVADRAFHTGIAAIIGNATLIRVTGEMFDMRMTPYFEKLASHFEGMVSWRQRAGRAPGYPRRDRRRAMRRGRRPPYAHASHGFAEEVFPKASGRSFRASRARPRGRVKQGKSSRLTRSQEKSDEVETGDDTLHCRRNHGDDGDRIAQTVLKWAHVYETSEPFHTDSVWAAEEIDKRTNGRYQIDGLSRLAARQGNRHQPGPDARHGRHHHLRLELRRHALSRRSASPIIPIPSAAPTT